MPAYKLSIFKSWGVRNRNNAWVNTYDINSSVPLDDPSWLTLVNNFVGAETVLHASKVHFLTAVVSTWAREPVYRHENLRVFPLNVTGNWLPLQELEDLPAGIDGYADLNYALQMKKNALLGRSGSVFYRGVLTMLDIATGSDGKPALSQFGAARFSGQTMQNFNGFFQSQNNPGFNWVMMPTHKQAAEQAGDGNTDYANNLELLSVRTITALTPSAVVLLPRDHKYYDRITPKKLARIQAYLRDNPPALPPGGVVDGEIVEE